MIRLCSQLRLVKSGSNASLWISLDLSVRLVGRSRVLLPRCFGRGQGTMAYFAKQQTPLRHTSTEAPGHDPGDLIIRIREKTCGSQSTGCWKGKHISYNVKVQEKHQIHTCLTARHPLFQRVEEHCWRVSLFYLFLLFRRSLHVCTLVHLAMQIAFFFAGTCFNAVPMITRTVWSWCEKSA